MRGLLASTSILAIAIIASTAPAAADQTVSTAITTPLRTSTATGGGPDNIVITSAGSVKPTSGAAVTVDSPNNLSNAGTIQITDSSNADGVLITTGGPATITNTGSIIVDENYTPTDTDNDGDIDGPFATGSNRFGIRSTGALSGSIVNSGTIRIEGNDSGGIKLGGPLTGSLNSSGTITVTGDHSVGIQTGAVSGNVSVSGTVSVLGAGAQGVVLGGDIGGTVVIQGAILSTGYRYTTLPADTSKLDADDLLQGGSAIVIAGSVAHGVSLEIPPVDADPANADEDGDGIPDASEGTASVSSIGSAAAIAVGGASPITLGSVTGAAGGEGLVIKGTVTGSGLYTGVAGTGIQVGGTGGTVNLSGGILISGNVTGVGPGGGTGLNIGSGVTMDHITVSGSLTGQAGAGSTARGLVIAAGSSVSTLNVSGLLGTATGDDGSAIAVRDLSGTLTTINNSGTISAAASNATTGSVIAIDVSANTTGVAIHNATSAATGTPRIVGKILFGSGADLLDIQRGFVTGDVDFGAGNNSLTLANGGGLTGNVTFGAGSNTVALTGLSHIDGTLNFGGGAGTLNVGSGTRVTGGIAGGAGVAATVNGSLNFNTTAATALGSLNVGSTGVIGITVNSTTNLATQLNVTGNASFAAGSTLRVGLTSVSTGSASYVIVQAGSLTGGSNLALNANALPFLFKGTLTSDAAAGTIRLDIARKSATELGFNRSESAAYSAVFAVIDSDTQIRDVFLSAADADTVRNRFNSFLPEHAGGLFLNATLAARAAARSLEDRPVEFGFNARKVSIFLNSVVWSASKSTGQTAAYDLSGWGAQGGMELPLGSTSRIGVTLGAFLGLDRDSDNYNSIETNQYEVGVHWRMRTGGFSTLARASYARLSFSGQRVFEVADAASASDNFRRTSKADWGGNLFSLTGAVAYELKAGQRLSFRPRVAADYYNMTESAYTETGGGTAFDLHVDKRSSNQTAIEGSLTIGYDLNQSKDGVSRLRLELEGGQRKILSGSVGATTARFGTGSSFTLDPEDRKDGWLGRIRLIGGSTGFTFGGEAGAEDQGGNIGYTFRASVQIGW